MGASIALHFGLGEGSKAPVRPEPQLPAAEREAFVVFLFGKVSRNDPAAIRPDSLREQLERLREEGYEAIQLEDAASFYQSSRLLPGKPVLLLFEEVGRETMELVDPILADLGLYAAAFVDVAAIEEKNLWLVSRRRLRQLAASGRWEFGLADRSAPSSPATAPEAGLEEWRKTLEAWTGDAVIAASCLGWAGGRETASWTGMLQQAALPIGFVARPPGANYREDDPTHLRMIRIPERSSSPTVLLRELRTHLPRRDRFADDFTEPDLPGWRTDWGEARVGERELQLSSLPGQSGAMVAVGGTERWRDGRVEVELAEPPKGQFWLYVRHGRPGPFVRLGIADGRVLLQISIEQGGTRVIASGALPPPPIHLGMRVIGNRALAFVNGERLQSRPASLPVKLTRGSVALMVWNSGGGASVRVRRFEAEPLVRRVALVEPTPTSQEWANLRTQSDDLWAVSSRIFAWQAGTTRALAATAPAVRMFVSHERLAFLAAATVDELPDAAHWQAFADQVQRWATEPGYDGIHLLLQSLPLDHGGAAVRLEDLRRQIAASGKELVLTIYDAAVASPVLAESDLPWSVAAGKRFPIAPSSSANDGPPLSRGSL